MRVVQKVIIAAFAAVAVWATPVLAAQQDEDFVRVKANEALAILADDTLGQKAKADRFRSYVDEVTDVPRVARFVLGKYARGADPKQLATFTEVFRQYASSVYESQLGNFGGETLKVLGSKDRKPGDSVVSSVISGGQIEEPLTVYWRIRTRNGQQKVLDVQVLGIWLALQQRNEITSVIANNGGDIGAAIAVLNNKIASQDFDAQEGASISN